MYLMPVLPHKSRATQRLASPSVKGKYRQALAHSKQWEYLKNKRLYQLMTTRPKEFTPAAKRELRHRHRYRETRGETYRKLRGPFQKGELGKGQFEKYKHALKMKENWKDYEAYKKYLKKGLENLTDIEFKRTNKFANFEFGLPPFRAYKKLQRKGLGFLSKVEWSDLNKIPEINISRKKWKFKVNLKKARQQKLIKREKGQLQLQVSPMELDRNEVDLLRSVGFTGLEYPDVAAYKKLQRKGLASLTWREVQGANDILKKKITGDQWTNAKNIQKAKDRGLIQGTKTGYKITKSMENLTQEDINLLNQLNMNPPDYSTVLAYKKLKKQGLENLSSGEFSKIKKYTAYDFGLPEFKAYKKLKKEGVETLTEQELRVVNRIQGISISPQTHRKKRKLFLAKRRGLVDESGGRMTIGKPLEDLSRSDVKLLRELGFSIPQYDRLQDVLAYRRGRGP